MILSSRTLTLAALTLLAACEMKIGDDERKQGAAGKQATASAEGKSRDGSISIDAPGFDMKLTIPDALKGEIGGESDVIYPGAKLGGLHIQADTGEGPDADRDSVELRFTTADAPAKVAAWYRDPARAKELTVSSAEQRGEGYRIAGTSKDDNDPFTLTLMPAAGGGTDGRIVLRDRGAR